MHIRKSCRQLSIVLSPWTHSLKQYRQYFPPTKEELASPQDAPEAPAEGQKSDALELDSEDWEKVERPAATDIVQPDDIEIKETVKGGISEGTQENLGGVDNNAQNQLMKDW